MEILGTTFIVTRTIYFMLEYKKTSRKIFNLHISCCSMKFKKRGGGGAAARGERSYVIFSTSKYQESKILLSLE